jgi:hypothetical protein
LFDWFLYTGEQTRGMKVQLIRCMVGHFEPGSGDVKDVAQPGPVEMEMIFVSCRSDPLGAERKWK